MKTATPFTRIVRSAPGAATARVPARLGNRRTPRCCAFVAMTVALVTAIVSPTIARAGLVTLDLCPAGTTSNLNLFGTGTASVGGVTVASWPSSKTAYRDYQFKLQTLSGTTSFDEFAVQLSASRRNSNTVTNTLRASLWTGAIDPNPILANALTTVTIPNSAVSSTGYSSVLLSGLTFPSQTIDTTPSTFFFRVWAEGDGSNSGFQTKMVNTKTELPMTTLSETVSGDIEGYIGVDQDEDGDFDGTGGDYYDFISYSTGVPEIDPQGMAAVIALVTAALGWFERRCTARPVFARVGGTIRRG